jgi:hypothetical protein
MLSDFINFVLILKKYYQHTKLKEDLKARLPQKKNWHTFILVLQSISNIFQWLNMFVIKIQLASCQNLHAFYKPYMV